MRFPGILLTALFIILIALTARGQKAERIDQLRSELRQAKTDTAQVRILLALAMTYQGFQMDSAMAFALKTLRKSEEINHTKGRADAMLHIGRLKRDQNREVEALNYMFDALKLYRAIEDNVQIANSLNDISIVYANSGDLKNALTYFKQSLDIFRKTGDEKGESYTLNNIGILYQEMNDLASAQEYYHRSLLIKIRKNDAYGISRGYMNLGSIAERGKQWEDALQYYRKADSIGALTNDKQVQAPNYLAMARVKQGQGKMMEASGLAMQAFVIAREMNAPSLMMSCSKVIAEAEEKAGNYRSSLTYQKIYNQLSDSLNEKNHAATLQELKAKFNLEERDREIVLLKKDRELHEANARNSRLTTYGLSAGIAFLIIVSALTFYAYRNTKAGRDILRGKNKEIEQQRDELDKLNKEKDRFFSILSHDLRAPLTSLKGLSYLQRHHGDVLTPEELADIGGKVDTSLENLTELIDNILEWSMTTSKKKMWKFDTFNTTSLIEKNLTLYKNIADSKGVRLVHDTGEDVYGYADYQAIDTVIRNLLSNSIKFSYPGSDVRITAEKSGNEVKISVRDQGVGMPPDLQEKLFSPQATVSQMGTQNEKGTGIGLMLCKELIKENNGDIFVKSAPGEGSEFIISFPVSAETGSRQSEERSPKQKVAG
jgi:signal transduction histidine kinase/Tfp pilus assembly protein PilF